MLRNRASGESMIVGFVVVVVKGAVSLAGLILFSREMESMYPTGSYGYIPCVVLTVKKLRGKIGHE